MATTPNAVGDLLRDWRARRRFSQLELASEAEVSTRHLSFVESGRASPSREMLLRLAEPLAMPLRERNRLLLAGGYAPLHGERALDQPDMAAAKAAVAAVLAGHEPFPALAVDRHWALVAANGARTPLLAGIAPHLLAPPVDVLRLSLALDGLAPRIVNLAEWRHHLLTRLRADIDRSGDAVLAGLHEELQALPFAAGRTPPSAVNAVAARTGQAATAWSGGSSGPTTAAVSRTRDGAWPPGRWSRYPIHGTADSLTEPDSTPRLGREALLALVRWLGSRHERHRATGSGPLASAAARSAACGAPDARPDHPATAPKRSCDQGDGR